MSEDVINKTAEEQHQPKTPSSHMIAVLTGIAMLSGFLVVLTSQITRPMIAENQRIAIENAIKQVIPGAVNNKKYQLLDGQLSEVIKGGNEPVIYVGYDGKGQLLGFASEASAQGYAGMVNLFYGYDPKCECIRGFKVLKMAETPGLGDKIISDANFQANFPVNAKVDPDKGQLSNAIITVKNGTKKNDWEIDAISGATITSRAVGKALNQSAQTILPDLLPLIDSLQIMEVE